MEGTTTGPRLTCGALLASVLCLACFTPPAHAGLLVASATNCDSATATRPFSRWLDNSAYVPVPGGGFEGEGPSWSARGASAVGGNEPWHVRDAGDDTSLAVPAGGSVTSAPICVGLDRPTLRLFARSNGSAVAQLVSALAVEVLFEDAGGNVHSLPIGVVKSPSAWSPTLPMVVLANLLPLLPGEKTAVAFRFTAVGGASWQLDDVYVDPKSRI
jgi:hypothetical protein